MEAERSKYEEINKWVWSIEENISLKSYEDELKEIELEINSIKLAEEQEIWDILKTKLIQN